MTNRFTAKCPYGKKSDGQVSLRRSVLTAKCPHGELSARRSVRTAKSPTAKSPVTAAKLLVAAMSCFALVHGYDSLR